MAAPTEVSRFWTTGGAGDGASTYTRDQLAEAYRAMFLADPTLQGVFQGLAVSGAASPMTLAIGSACVYGYLYFCTVAGDVTKSTPAVGTTGFRVVLTADWTAQTVRVAVVSSADGVSAIPAVTQSAGTTWQITLATGTITTGGVITLTDARAFCAAGPSGAALSVLGRSANSIGALAAIVAASDGDVLRRSGTAVGFGQIATAGITDDAVTAAKVADGAIDATAKMAANIVDDTIVGNRVPQFYRRQGGDATDWSDDGTTTYTPGAVRQQAGIISLGNVAAGDTVTGTVTFPTAFSSSPLVFLQIYSGTLGEAVFDLLGTWSGADFEYIVKNTGAGLSPMRLAWFAVGPE